MKKNPFIIKDTCIVENKKAAHSYFLLDFYEAGIQLLGSEVKSIRLKHCSIGEAYIQIIRNEIWIINMHISKYSFSNSSEHNHLDPRRTRKLLLHKHEILKIQKKKLEKSLTIVPISIFLKKNKVKIKIAIAKGKKLYDKREALKEKAIDLSMRRNANYF